MNGDASPAFRNLERQDRSVNAAREPANGSLKTVNHRHASGVSIPAPIHPSNRIIYLDEESMRTIGLQLVSDLDQFNELSTMPNNDYLQLKSIFDAQMLNAAYFARRIWDVSANETLVDIPPLLRDKLYPGVMVRLRALVKSREDLRPDRLTLTNMGGEATERIHVLITNRGTISANRSFLAGQVLCVVGQLRKLDPLSLAAAAVLLAPSSKDLKSAK
jgi:hypothetical protein